MSLFGLESFGAVLIFLRVNICQMWDGLIEKAKDGGLDVIQTYVFWNGHEPTPGNVLSLSLLTPFFNSVMAHQGFQWFLLASCSTILKGGTIWSGSSRLSRRLACLFISASVPTFVESGILGIPQALI